MCEHGTLGTNLQNFPGIYSDYLYNANSETL